MTNDEILAIAKRVVEAHIRAINSGDEEAMRRQLVGSHRERPFRVYCDDMKDLRPLAILSMEFWDPRPATTPPYPRSSIGAVVDLASGAQRDRVLLHIWIPQESGTAVIAGRITMRKNVALEPSQANERCSNPPSLSLDDRTL